MGNPLNPVYDAVAWVLKQVYGVLSPVFGDSSGWTWALSIVILVVLMRLIMVPLFIKQMHTTRAMTALAPQMTALRKKYKNDKQTLNEEMMKLYREAGVNPLMGCLPVVAQLPMFFALFSVLRAIAEWKSGQPVKYHLTHQMVQSAKNAKILGATVADKFLFTDGVHVPLHAKIVILLAVLVSMATTYLTVRQSMKRGMMPAATPDNPMGQSQKYMAYIMPFFALSGLYWPFGLVLYWVTTNLWTLGQQYVLFRRYPQPAAAAVGGSDAIGAPGAGGAGRPQPKPSRPSLPAAPAAGGNGSGTANGKVRGQRSSPGGAAPGSAAPGSTSPGGAGPGGAKSGGAGSGGAGSGGAGPGGAGPGGAKPGGAKPVRTAQNNGRRSAASTPARKAPTAGQPPAAGGGMLRRFAKGRSEPEPEPQLDEPEVKLVRQQPQRQSRSKRSGKR